jgi:glycosyltransferase involved in cell wall biosynthesis
MINRIRQSNGLSIIVPVYNEEKTIQQVITQLMSMKKSIPNIDIIIIDDGSTDNTSRVILKLKQEYDIQVIRHSKNRGYGVSLKTGVRASQKDFTAFFDSDGQHRVDDLILLFDGLEDNDLIVGYRSNMHQTKIWRSPLKIFLKIFFAIVLLKRIKDPTSGLRIWKTSKIRPILSKCSDGFSFSASSLLFAYLLDYKTEWRGIKMNKRKSGISQFGLSKIFKVIATLLKIVISVKPKRIILLIAPLILILFTSLIAIKTLG